MKIQTALTLAILLAIAPDVSAQRGGRGGGGGGGGPVGPPAGGGGGGARGGGPVVSRPVAAAAASQRATTTTTNIPAMGNPVPPVISYRGNPSLGNSAARERPVAAASVGRNFRYDRRDRYDDVIVVGGGAYWDPYYPVYSPYSYYPYMTPPPIPGQLPGVYYVPEPVEVAPPDPALYAVPPAPAAGGAADFIEVYEPRMIITPPEPERTVEPPALGTSRAEVLSRYGQPWGTISTKSKETLYFRSLTVILEEGKVSEVR